MFMPHSNQTDQDFDDLGVFCTKNTVESTTQSPIYNVINDHLSPSVIYGMEIVRLVLMIVALSNILEGAMYLHIFIYARR